MGANLVKIKEMGGRITSVSHKGKNYIAALVPDDGFEKLAYMADDRGQYLWVNKNFQK